MAGLASRFAFLFLAISSAYLSNAAPSATNANMTPTCTKPTSLANTFVPVPAALNPSFQVKPAFAAAHTLFLIDNLSASFSEASVGTLCLETCVAYQSNGTTGPCLSFNVNYGKPVNATGPTQFFCTGFDAFIARDGSDVERVDIPGSYMFPINVNRVCSGSYRAY